ncbi:hypothetical protein HOLleu_36159 [Holothuria leucospilota]|uniref:Uncharacterized protein n=1 Tax=Holothuria leucospilota TaxID=206669 RepID=A0A9Q0YJL2_HOLLE|nr:hypothetical protein HOLleu_36159 [Holothuria leucospilota]
MDFPFFRTTTRMVYLFLLSTFIYLAFVSSRTNAAPFQSYEDDEDLESMFEADINSICESSGISTATRVLCRLIELRSGQAEPELLPYQWQNQRVSKRESSSFSSFQRHVNEVRRLAKNYEHWRQRYQKLVSKGLVNGETGEVIDLPSSDSYTKLRNSMGSVG